MPSTAMTTVSQDPKFSERFNAADSDITLASRDNVHFKVHRINLKMHSDIFADAEDISSSTPNAISEVVSLTETASTLDLLLQYMYRQPPPDLSEIEFSRVADLAEAAEKYRVYFAIDACKRSMCDAIPEHSFEVLTWAVKHKHNKIIDQAAQHSVSLPTDDICEAISPPILAPWLQYHKHWLDALNAEYVRYPPTVMHWNNSTRECDIPCEAWTHSYAMITHKLGAKPHLLLKLDEVFGPSEDYLQTRCGECKETLATWRTIIVRELERIPKFSTLV
ncbi:uncharacterized protein EV420DRAFT_1547224 [Desarmillaria tabescens]|uniref:BTB domain-containing protein n=1 Tax=Armillaria tabescens TaxID=1929756 RepID=A0AA39N592_ARMTA|nr:uncharacterized protein EV420DRAFT_1547224 [Desarmillaria tabescens]KAK0457760.1 hypothetical protein EV420DRAFT_1547224 [Desarmillaria tabescens]